MGSNRTLLAFTLGVVLAAPATAHADEASQARFHNQLAQKLYRQEKFEEALRNFFVVRRLSPDPQTLFNIALCFDQLGRSDQAFLFFTRFLSDEDISDVRREFAEARVKQLGREVGQLRIETSPPGARVYIDFREYGSWGETPITMPLSPGTHQIWLSKPNHREIALEVEARLGQATTVLEELEPILGRLRVTSSPEGEVLVSDPDGATVARGPTPFEEDLPPGVYVLEVSSAGYRSERSVLEVSEDQVTERAIGLTALPTKQGEVTVTANLTGALIEIDGEPAGFAPDVANVDVGLHDLKISYEGLEPWAGEVEVYDEGRGYVTTTLRPPPKTERHVATWVLGGIGLSALGAATITGILALDANSEFNDIRDRGNPDGTNLQQLRDQGQTLAGVTDALLVAGGISLVASTVLFFVTAKKTQPSEAEVTWETK